MVKSSRDQCCCRSADLLSECWNCRGSSQNYPLAAAADRRCKDPLFRKQSGRVGFIISRAESAFGSQFGKSEWSCFREHQYSGLEDVSRIEIEADFADIEIRKSDHLYIVTEGLPANNESDGYRSFRFNCSQGLLRIDSETEESMSILSPTAGKIIVNVPDKAESLYAETALGNISAEKLNIQSAEFEADLGNISLNQISGQSLSAECNAGEISADQISFKKAVFINDLGNISVN